MRVIIIHDRPEVAAKIREIVNEAPTRCHVVDVARDVFAAKEYLSKNWYELAIIDLTLPIMPGLPETRLEYADALLKEMFAGDVLKTPADVIGISRDTSAVAGIRSAIGQHVLALIEEDPEGLWCRLLRDKVRYVNNSRRGRLLAAKTCHELDVFILTALDKESAPYSDLLELTPSDEVAGGREFTFTARDGHPKRGLLLSVGKSGQAPTASAAQAVISQVRPRLAIMTGFCGGVKARVGLGDVAVFSSAAAWDYGKWIEGARGKRPMFEARPDALNIPVRGVSEVIRKLVADKFRFADPVLNQVVRLSGSAERQLEVACVAAGSGSAVVTSEDVVAKIVGLNENIHAIDMESYAFYYACLNTSVVQPDFVCIKGVADHCNGEKNSKWHAPCSILSATLALEIVRNRYDFPVERRN
jgi:nucleoside phosphorylase